MSRTRSPRTARRLSATLALALATSLVGIPAGAATDPARGQQWGLDVIDAEQAWQTGRGSGVVIAIVDSGVDLRHEDLVDRLVPGIDVVDGDRTPQDGYGHGTHVAGIAAASGGNGRGIAGVAPDARIMPVRVLDDDGSGSSADVSEGIRWAVDNGADVVNLSLGQRAQAVFGSSLIEAIDYAWSKGVVVIVAAGNEFVLSSGFSDEPAIVVSATTRDDGVPDYSNGVGNARWGIAAPGGGCSLLTCAREDDVFSTYWDPGRSDVYAFLAGTSMAAPHVAGAAAILLGLGLSPQQTVDRLLATAEDLGADGRDSTYGSGRLDVAAAVRGLGGAQPAAPSTPRPSAPTTSQPAAPSSPSPRATTAPQSSSPTEPATSDTTAPTPDTSSDGTPAAAAPPTPGAPATGSPAPAPSATTSPSPSASDLEPTRPDTGTNDTSDALAAGSLDASEDSDTPGWLVLLALLLLAGAAASALIRAREER